MTTRKRRSRNKRQYFRRNVVPPGSQNVVSGTGLLGMFFFMWVALAGVTLVTVQQIFFSQEVALPSLEISFQMPQVESASFQSTWEQVAESIHIQNVQLPRYAMPDAPEVSLPDVQIEPPAFSLEPITMTSSYVTRGVVSRLTRSVGIFSPAPLIRLVTYPFEAIFRTISTGISSIDFPGRVTSFSHAIGEGISFVFSPLDPRPGIHNFTAWYSQQWSVVGAQTKSFSPELTLITDSLKESWELIVRGFRFEFLSPRVQKEESKLRN